jgi:hypothetical protein
MTAMDLDKYARLMRYYKRASRDGKLRLMISLERRIIKMENSFRINPR